MRKLAALMAILVLSQVTLAKTTKKARHTYRPQKTQFEILLDKFSRTIGEITVISDGFRAKTIRIEKVTPEMLLNFTKEMQPLVSRLFSIERQMISQWLNHPDSDNLRIILDCGDVVSSQIWYRTGTITGNSVMFDIGTSLNERASNWVDDIWYIKVTSLDYSKLTDAELGAFYAHIAHDPNILTKILAVSQKILQILKKANANLDVLNEYEKAQAGKLSSRELMARVRAGHSWRRAIQINIELCREMLASQKISSDLWLENIDPITCVDLANTRTMMFLSLIRVAQLKWTGWDDIDKIQDNEHQSLKTIFLGFFDRPIPNPN